MMCYYNVFLQRTRWSYNAATSMQRVNRTGIKLQADHFSEFLRIFPFLKILFLSIVLKCQAAWITIRRRVTRRLIGIQAVWKYRHSFFCRTHICPNLWIFHGPVMVTLYLCLHLFNRLASNIIIMLDLYLHRSVPQQAYILFKSSYNEL